MSGLPAMAALEFCALIRGKETTPGGTAAFAILDERERVSLDDLLARYGSEGGSARLERQARVFLTAYRERARHAGVLDHTEQARLDAILDGRPEELRPRLTPRLRLRPRMAALALAAAAAAVLVAVVPVLHGQHLGSSPGTGQVPQHPPAQQVPPVATDLQRAEALLGPWQTIAPSTARPATGTPAVLLLNGGSEEASTRWAVPAGTGGWAQDMSGAVDGVDLHGTWAQITGADGTAYIVGIDQAFLLGADPGTVFRISPDGTPQYLTLAQAIAGRQHIRTGH